MANIEPGEEFVWDWDWYACDQEGNIGHFTTAGLRRLPSSVKDDRNTLKRVARYLSEELQEWTGYSIRNGVDADIGRTQLGRDYYLRSFIQSARRGMFSYDTEIRRGPDAKYYLVAKPDRSLRTTDLPPDVAAILSRTHAEVSFAMRDYLSEAETLNW